MAETGVPRENHGSAASHWQTLSHNCHNFVSSTCTSGLSEIQTHNVSGNRHWLHWLKLFLSYLYMSSFDKLNNYCSDWCDREKCFCSSCKFQAVPSPAWIVSCFITYFIFIICVCLLVIWSNLFFMCSYLFFGICKSKNDRKHYGQKEKNKRTNNDLQNTSQKTKDQATRTPLKGEGELMCSGRVCSSCSTSGIHCATLVIKPVISHE